MTDQPRRGRPPKPSSERYRTPQRQLGRVSDADWQDMQDAAAATGQPFSHWARGVLLRAAKRISGSGSQGK